MENSATQFSISVAPKAKKRRTGGGETPTPTPRTIGASNNASVGIRALDVTSLEGSQRIGVVGLPGTGKSTAALSLLVALQQCYPVVCVCSGSENDNPFYTRVLPRIFVHNKVTQARLKMFINRQRLAVANKSPLMDALLILDDVFDHPESVNNAAMRLLYKQGRHLHTSVWCLQQLVLDLKPWARSTTSAVVLFYCPSVRDRRLLFENYGSGFPDFATFNALYTFITSQKHTAMVILLNRGESDLLKSVFWYKPTYYESTENIRLGHPSIWEHADRRTDESRINELSLLSCHSADEK